MRAVHRWVPAWEWTWGTTCGCRATFCCASPSCTTSRSHSTPSLSLATGTAPAATATSPPRALALLLEGQLRHASFLQMASPRRVMCTLRIGTFPALTCTPSCNPVSKLNVLQGHRLLYGLVCCQLYMCAPLRRADISLYRWEEIQKHIGKLEKRHAVHIASYGEGNERRLTGKHETSSMHDFRCACNCAQCRHGCRTPLARGSSAWIACAPRMSDMGGVRFALPERCILVLCSG